MAFVIPDFNSLMATGMELYNHHFGENPTVSASAPGRVNIIGEHTDYSEGYVFPMGLQFLTIVLGKRNQADVCRIATETKIDPKRGIVEFDVPSKAKLIPGQPAWANYVKGVVNWFPGDVMGFNAVIVSSVPAGAGLSSSAALEVATFTFLEALTETRVDLQEKAQLCQKAEHTFADVPCGIMDQLISVRASKGYILCIDCRSLEFEQVPFKDNNLTFLVIDSKVKHNLNEGNDEYRKRKDACESVARLLQIKSLRDASMKDIDVLLKKEIINEKTYKRARHVIKENMRVYQAVSAIKKKDFDALGLLMIQSHYSLRYDYEVSCDELDSLVEIAMSTKGVLGARMTGAGFGGCTVNLVRKDRLNEIIKDISDKYTMSDPDFIEAVPSDGAKVINVNKFLDENKCDS